MQPLLQVAALRHRHQQGGCFRRRKAGGPSALGGVSFPLRPGEILGVIGESGSGMLVITHDLAVVWRLAQRVLVLQGGVVHEQGDTAQVFAEPASAYRPALLLASTRASRLTGAEAEDTAAV